MHFDNWDLTTLREAKAARDANPDPRWADTDAYMDSLLAQAEAQLVHATPTPVADTHNVPLRDRKPGNGFGSGTTGASEAQEKFIRSLCAERGVDADALLATIKDKRQASQAIDRLKAQPRQEQIRPVTERQREYLQDLLSSRQHAYGDDILDHLNFAAASALIDELLRSPRVGKVADHGIRHGRYAFQPAEGPAQFYRVGQNGRITVIAGPAEYPYNGKLNAALEAIKADTRAAAALYGQLIGSCGRCGLTLTDEHSRAVGLGPICEGKSDW